MSNQTITLKTVNDLRLNASGEVQRYFIASYQRGYRWSALQVTQLLEDIREFTRRRDPQPEEFYCLQPLVLKVSVEGGYEVVDGQQRLTTLLLILRHFNERLTEKFQQQLFTLDYETRPNLLDFLDHPTESLANSNADYFHLFGAVKTIEKWVRDHDNEVDEIKPCTVVDENERIPCPVKLSACCQFKIFAFAILFPQYCPFVGLVTSLLSQTEIFGRCRIFLDKFFFAFTGGETF